MISDFQAPLGTSDSNQFKGDLSNPSLSQQIYPKLILNLTAEAACHLQPGDRCCLHDGYVWCFYINNIESISDPTMEDGGPSTTLPSADRILVLQSERARLIFLAMCRLPEDV